MKLTSYILFSVTLLSSQLVWSNPLPFLYDKERGVATQMGCSYEVLTRLLPSIDLDPTGDQMAQYRLAFEEIKGCEEADFVSPSNLFAMHVFIEVFDMGEFESPDQKQYISQTYLTGASSGGFPLAKRLQAEEKSVLELGLDSINFHLNNIDQFKCDESIGDWLMRELDYDIAYLVLSDCPFEGLSENAPLKLLRLSTYVSDEVFSSREEREAHLDRLISEIESREVDR